jgi:hypothetical protein
MGRKCGSSRCHPAPRFTHPLAHRTRTIHAHRLARVIVTAVERIADLGQLSEVSGHGVLDEFFRRAAGGRGELLEAGFGFGLKVNDHDSQSSGEERCRPKGTALREHAGVAEFASEGSLTSGVPRGSVRPLE